MGEHDVGAPLHRNMGVHVARGVPAVRIFCQYMGRDGGASRGRDSNLRTQTSHPATGSSPASATCRR
jgi:TPP-dependent pyruvate/acetoin dehydrogenase alpha subunit